MEGIVALLESKRTRLELRETPEMDQLIQHLRMPLQEGKITWQVRWKFNECIREIDATYPEENQQWSRQAIKELEMFKAHLLKWTQRAV
jgi:hypothetical protein